MTIDEVQAVEVDVLEFEACADVMVEQRKLDAQLAQRIPDLRGQPWRRRISSVRVGVAGVI